MRTKIKASKIFLLVLSLLLVIPLAFAFDGIRDFLADMRTNPNNYYIWNNRAEPEMVSRIQNFANDFGVQVSNTQIFNKKPVIISVAEETFAQDEVIPTGISYVEQYQDHIAIYLIVEDGFTKYISNLSVAEKEEMDIDGNGDISEYEVLYDYLDAALDYLSNYGAMPSKDPYFEIAQGQIIEERTNLSCADFVNYDKDIYVKDEYIDKGFKWSDFCINKTFNSELTCVGNSVSYQLTACSHGCFGGRCIYSTFDYTQEYYAQDISPGDFFGGVIAWLES